jgi:thymidine phosphorylase
MADIAVARTLAKSMVSVANGAGMKTSALITDMNEPRASAAGNAVEVQNAVDFLTGEHRDPRLYEVTVALAGEVLATGGLAADAADGRRKIEAAFASGKAADLFGKMVSALGGPADFVERSGKYLEAAPVVRAVTAEHPGVVTAIDTRAVGIACIELGGGRAKADDKIDHAVGFTRLAGLGTSVGGSYAALGVVHARSDAAADRATAALRKAYKLGDVEPPPAKNIYERIGV